jgi:phosphopantothenoylcysteine synthetase/decarboxylase
MEFGVNPRDPGERLAIRPYQTFDDLTTLMQSEVRAGGYDVVCHSAAVSDYLPAGAFAPARGTFFNARTGQWETNTGPPTLIEQKAGKIKSTEPELWVRLVRAPKLIDRVRKPWSFAGVLVKFKLEVGIGEDELLRVAEASRQQSEADLMVANTLDGAAHWAYLGPWEGRYERVTRRELADRLVVTIEDLYEERAGHG